MLAHTDSGHIRNKKFTRKQAKTKIETTQRECELFSDDADEPGAAVFSLMSCFLSERAASFVAYRLCLIISCCFSSNNFTFRTCAFIKQTTFNIRDCMTTSPHTMAQYHITAQHSTAQQHSTLQKRDIEVPCAVAMVVVMNQRTKNTRQHRRAEQSIAHEVNGHSLTGLPAPHVQTTDHIQNSQVNERHWEMRKQRRSRKGHHSAGQCNVTHTFQRATDRRIAS